MYVRVARFSFLAIILIGAIAGCSHNAAPSQQAAAVPAAPQATTPQTAAQLIAALKALPPSKRQAYMMQNQNILRQLPHDPATAVQIHQLIQ